VTFRLIVASPRTFPSKATAHGVATRLRLHAPLAAYASMELRAFLPPPVITHAAHRRAPRLAERHFETSGIPRGSALAPQGVEAIKPLDSLPSDAPGRSPHRTGSQSRWRAGRRATLHRGGSRRSELRPLARRVRITAGCPRASTRIPADLLKLHAENAARAGQTAAPQHTWRSRRFSSSSALIITTMSGAHHGGTLVILTAGCGPRNQPRAPAHPAQLRRFVDETAQARALVALL